MPAVRVSTEDGVSRPDPETPGKGNERKAKYMLATIHQVCGRSGASHGSLVHSISTPSERRATPVLSPNLDSEICHSQIPSKSEGHDTIRNHTLGFS